MNLNKKIEQTYNDISVTINDNLFKLVDGYARDLLSNTKKFVSILTSELKTELPSNTGKWSAIYPEKIVVDPEYLTYDKDIPLQLAYIMNRDAGISIILNRNKGVLIASIVIDSRTVKREPFETTTDIVEMVKEYY